MTMVTYTDLKKQNARNLDRTLSELQSRCTYLGKLIIERKIARAFGDQIRQGELSRDINIAEARIEMLKLMITEGN